MAPTNTTMRNFQINHPVRNKITVVEKALIIRLFILKNRKVKVLVESMSSTLENDVS